MSAGIRWGCRLQNCDQQLKTGELVRGPIRHVRLLSSQWDLVLSSGFLQSRERESIPGVLSLQSSSRRDRVCRINHHGCQWSEFTSCEEVGTAVRGFLPHFPKHLQWWNFNADFNKWGPIAATLTSLGLTQSLNLSCRCHTFIEFGLTQTFISAAGLGWYWRTASQDGCDCLLGGGGGGACWQSGGRILQDPSRAVRRCQSDFERSRRNEPLAKRWLNAVPALQTLAQVWASVLPSFLV